jgi:hypothetical protein
MKTPISDQTINRNVTQLLASAGLRSPCHVVSQTRNGEVTLTGTVLRQQQRDMANQMVGNVEGVRRVVDRINIKPQVKQPFDATPAYFRLPSKEAQATAQQADGAPADGAPAEAAQPGYEMPMYTYDKQGKRIKTEPPAAPPGASAPEVGGAAQPPEMI